MSVLGNEYSWEDVSFVVAGKSNPVVGITEIDYGPEKEHKDVYGKGADPVAMSRGQKKYFLNFSMLQSEVEAWQKTMPSGKDLTDKAPFGVTIGYNPEINDVPGPAVYDVCQFVRIKKYSKAFKNTDGNMVVKFDCAVAKITMNK